MVKKPGKSTLSMFNAISEPIYLPGGEGRSYKSGNFVLKHINEDSVEYAEWVANLFNTIQEDGFRVSRPIKSKTGKWITDEEWTAWTFLEGSHDFEGKIDESIKAIKSFHYALKTYPKPKFIETDSSAYNRADRFAWGDKPGYIHPDIKEEAERLYSIRRPIETPEQLIHGDLNPDNILLTPGQQPGIIDIAPYWRSADFGLAIYAYWICAYRDRSELLAHFTDIPNFKQHLIRAGIRMLLIMSEFNKVEEIEKYKKATEIIESIR